MTLPSAWSKASTTFGTLSARARTQRSNEATPMICRSGMRTILALMRTFTIGGGRIGLAWNSRNSVCSR